MAKILGTLPQEPRRSLLGTLAATVNPVARQKAELQEGEGLRRLVQVLRQLPDHVTAILQPTLGWMLKADAVVIGPGRVMVLSACHWKGLITAGKEEEWLGAGRVDLGRPDKRAYAFAKRLDYSGHAEGFDVDPVVVFTDGPVSFGGPSPLATFLNWDEAPRLLAEAFPPGGPDFDPAELVTLLGGK